MTLLTTLKAGSFKIIPETKDPSGWINSDGGVQVTASQRLVGEEDTPSFQFDVSLDYRVSAVKTWPIVEPTP